MENLYQNCGEANDLDSWLKTNDESTRYCENCLKLTQTVKSRETVLKKLKSRIITTDKIIKQFNLKKNDLSKTQFQLATVTEKLQKTEKIAQILQNKVAGFLKQCPSDQKKEVFEKTLSVKDSTIKDLEQRLQFSEGECKLYKESSEVSLTQVEKLKDEAKNQSKLIQTLEAKDKKTTIQLEKYKKEISESKTSLSETKKFVKSLEKEVFQLKEKKESYFQILLDNGLLPKKDFQATNRKKSTLCNNKKSISVDFISNEEENVVTKKKDTESPCLIDVKSIIEEICTIPQMLSPITSDDESDQDSSFGNSEKSVNDLAKLLELEFLDNPDFPIQELNQKNDLEKETFSESKIIDTNNGSINSSLQDLPLSNSLKNTAELESAFKVIGLDTDKSSSSSEVTGDPLPSLGLTVGAPLSSNKYELNEVDPLSSTIKSPNVELSSTSSNIAVEGSAIVDPLLSNLKKESTTLKSLTPASIGSFTVNSLSEEEEKKIKYSPQLKLSSSTQKSSCYFEINDLALSDSSSDLSDVEELHPATVSSSTNKLSLNPSSSDDKLIKVPQSIQQTSPQHNSFQPSSVEESENKENDKPSFNKQCTSNPVETSVPNEPSCDFNPKPHLLSVRTERLSSGDETKVVDGQLELIEPDANLNEHIKVPVAKSFNSDMVDLFGSELISSSSSDTDEETISEDPYFISDKTKLPSVKTESENICAKQKLTEINPLLQNEYQIQKSTMNSKPKNLLEEKSNSDLREKPDTNLNGETVVKLLTDDHSLKNTEISNNSDDPQIKPHDIAKSLETEKKNTKNDLLSSSELFCDSHVISKQLTLENCHSDVLFSTNEDVHVDPGILCSEPRQFDAGKISSEEIIENKNLEKDDASFAKNDANELKMDETIVENFQSDIFSKNNNCSTHENVCPENECSQFGFANAEINSIEEFQIRNDSTEKLTEVNDQKNKEKPFVDPNESLININSESLSSDVTERINACKKTNQIELPADHLLVTKPINENKFSVINDDNNVIVISQKLNDEISSVENNTFIKKGKILTEADINRVDPLAPLFLVSIPGENKSSDPVCSFDGDKENDQTNMNEKIISNPTELRKMKKSDLVHDLVDRTGFLHLKEAEDSSQSIKNSKSPNEAKNICENSKDVESQSNNTKAIPKSSFSENFELRKNDSKTNSKNILNLKNLSKNNETSEIVKNEEISDKFSCPSTEDGRIYKESKNSLEKNEFVDRSEKSEEHFEKSIKKISIENGKGKEIDSDSEKLKNDQENQITNQSNPLSENFVESERFNIVKNSEDLITLSKNENRSKYSRTDCEEHCSNFNESKSLSGFSKDCENFQNNIEKNDIDSKFSQNSDVPKNGIEEISNLELQERNLKNTEGLLNDEIKEVCQKNPNSNGFVKDSRKNNVKCENHNSLFLDKNPEDQFNLTMEVKKESLNVYDNCKKVDENNSFCIKEVDDKKEISSNEYFSDLELTELIPTTKKVNSGNNINISELFGDDNDDDETNSKCEELLENEKQQKLTSSLSNCSDSSRANICDSPVCNISPKPVSLFVNKEQISLKTVLSPKKMQTYSSHSLKSKRKRMPVFKMATFTPNRHKLSKKSAEKLSKSKLTKSVIKSKLSLINFVASSEKLFHPNVLMENKAGHENKSLKINEEKEKKDSVLDESISILQNSSLSSTSVDNSCPKSSNHLENENIIFTEQLFAGNSAADDVEDISECIKEFILVTRPISPLPMSPQKALPQLHDYLSPSKEQTTLNESKSISKSSDCDSEIDVKSFINIMAQLSPIVTPKKLREQKEKKNSFKDFKTEDNGTEKAATNTSGLLTSLFAAHSVNVEGQKGLPECSTLSNSSPVPPQHKINDPTIELAASQPVEIKKCLKSQQRLLRKTRSLHRINPLPVTSAKYPKLNVKNQGNDSINPTLHSLTSNSQKTNNPLETLSKPEGISKMEAIDSSKEEKAPSLGDLSERTKVKSVRKRELESSKSEIEKVPKEKKQCTKNNAILSRARASLMKVAERELLNYWKYPSTPPSNILQKLLQTNREADLITEVVVLQAVKLLSFSTDNMMPWYITKCKSNEATPYFSVKEKHLLQLFCLFKKRKEMSCIFSKFRVCLKEALTKQDWESSDLGKWSLCRMYFAMCRLEGCLYEARVFFYTRFCCLPCDQYITFAVVTACTWPLVLSYQRKAGHVSLFRVIEYAVIKSLNDKQHKKKFVECLVMHCKWKPSGSNNDNDIQRSLFTCLDNCIETGATKDEIFCYVKGVELMSLQEKWLWTVSFLRNRMSPLLKKYYQFEPSEGRQSEFDCLLCHIFQVIGKLCLKSQKRHKIINFVINSLLKPFLISDKFSTDVRLCCIRVLMGLYPFEPFIVYPLLELWFQENPSLDPSSNLQNEWILLKDEINKQMIAVT